MNQYLIATRSRQTINPFDNPFKLGKLELLFEIRKLETQLSTIALSELIDISQGGVVGRSGYYSTVGWHLNQYGQDVPWLAITPLVDLVPWILKGLKKAIADDEQELVLRIIGAAYAVSFVNHELEIIARSLLNDRGKLNAGL